MMTLLFAAAHLKGPHIDWASFSPVLAPAAGGLIILMVGLLGAGVVRRHVVPALTILTFLAMIGLAIWRFHHPASIISGALRIDDLALEIDMLLAASGIATVLLSWRAFAPREAGQGEYHSLLLLSVFGMAVFVSAQNLITLFLGIELLSIPLYILCASETRREASLESGLKYLIIGSVGSATLVYGLALVYGATGATDFSAIGAAASAGKLAGGSLGNPMFLTGLGLIVVGFSFKASVAPFHQWTPDVYQGAPTPITAFMATATKAAALIVFIRFFDQAAIGAQNTWAPLLATIAAITMIVGNVGALGQASLKRMLGYSGVAQAGYMLTGVVVGTQLGIQATVLYLLAYLGMNLAPFAVIVAAERERPELRRRHHRAERARRAQSLAGLADDDRHAGPGRDPRHGRVHRQVPAHQRAGQRRLHVAGHRARHRLDDLPWLLPAGGGHDLDAPGAGPAAGDGRRLSGGRRLGRGPGLGRGRLDGPPLRGRLRGARLRRRGDLLRHLPLAALPLRRPRRPRPRRAVLDELWRAVVA